MDIYLNLCHSYNFKRHCIQKMSNQNSHKLSIIEAKNIASKCLFIERLRPIFFAPSNRQTYTPRI
jgi:hypothetical protein